MGTLKQLLLVILFVAVQRSDAQTDTTRNLFADEQYEYSLMDRIPPPAVVSETATIYSAAYMARAKLDQDWRKLFRAYKSHIYLGPLSQRLLYADSLIIVGTNSGDTELSAMAHVLKGTVLGWMRRYEPALAEQARAVALLRAAPDDFVLQQSGLQTGIAKYQLGYYEQAIQRFEAGCRYFKNEDISSYFKSLYGLALAYIATGQYDTALTTATLGRNECLRVDNSRALPFFDLAGAIAQYYKQHYNTSLAALLLLHPKPLLYDDFDSSTAHSFYMARNYMALKQPGQALPYLHKIAKTTDRQSVLLPQFRKTYELLIDYYRKQEQPEVYLRYVQRLMYMDSVYNADFSHLAPRIVKQYDTAALLRLQHKTEWLLSRRAISSLMILVLMLGVAVWIFIGISRNRRNRIIDDNGLLATDDNPQTTIGSRYTDETALRISPDVISRVLGRLDEFEAGMMALEPQLTLSRLAAITDVNATYLSRIIRFYKHKAFADYINDLKIDYIANKYTTDRRYRNYSNKALAAEAGFGTDKNFAIAFKRKMGMSVASYLKQLETTQK